MIGDGELVSIGRRAQLLPGAASEYARRHTVVWPEVEALNAAAGISRYRIFISGNDLFSYSECRSPDLASELIAASSVGAEWQRFMAPLMAGPNPMAPWSKLRCVYPPLK